MRAAGSFAFSLISCSIPAALVYSIGVAPRDGIPALRDTTTSEKLGNVAKNAIPKKDRAAGCGIVHDWEEGSHQNFTITSRDVERYYYVHLPKNYDPEQETGVVVLFHPAATEAMTFDRYSGFSTEEVNPNYITVAPQGIHQHWQGAPYSPFGVDDLTFAGDLIEQLKQDFCVHPEQVYSVGHSNGGGFLGSLACSEHGNAYKAFAPMAPALYTDVAGDDHCDFTNFRPILEIHGLDDDVTNYDGGESNGHPIPSIPEWVQRWAVRNKCDETPEVETEGDRIQVSYTCDGRKGLLEHLILKGHGHGYIGLETDGQPMEGFLSPTIMKWFDSLSEEVDGVGLL